MQRIVTKLMLGLALMALFYFGMCWMINHLIVSGKRAACWVNPQFQRKGGQEYRLMQDWNMEANYEVLVLGSSHAYRGYDPREFEKHQLTLFAAGSGFQNTMASYILSKDIFHVGKNSLVIIDLFDQTFEGDGLGCFGRVMQNMGTDAAAKELLWRKPDLRVFNSFWCRMFSKNAPTEVPDEEGYLFNGYCPKTDTLQTLPAEMNLGNEIEFNIQFAHYLDLLIAQIKSDSAQVVLVSHPQPKLESFTQYHQAFLKFIQPVIQKHQVEYLDYNSDHSLNNFEHFADANHLNQAGVTEWNGILIGKLSELHLLPAGR